jgi:hypothetical protein
MGWAWSKEEKGARERWAGLGRFGRSKGKRREGLGRQGRLGLVWFFILFYFLFSFLSFFFKSILKTQMNSK